jgi:predicted glycoside hydrolase/deacetylase ChbG (UPF0249 family)
MARMLIVNADDWGIDTPTTDAIAECFAAGLVTSATAMVFMADSQRAAAVARAIGLPIGLHLNLSEPFTAADVPPTAQRAHATVTRRFDARARRWRRWIPDPLVRGMVEGETASQLAAFGDLYGRRPTHVDGHKHVQVSPTVASTPALSGLMLRPAFTDPPNGRRVLRLARRARHRLLLASHGGADRLLSLQSMSEDLLAGRRPAALDGLGGEIVEVMAHPGLPDERSLLETAAWADALRSEPLGSYADLR